MSRSHWVHVWVAVLCFLAPSPLWAADKKPAPPRPMYDTGQAAIEKALAAPITLDFTDTPLEEVLDYLRDCCRIEIVLDSRGLGECGIDTGTPITKSLHNLPLRSALRLILREHGLTWTIQDDVLLVTTPEEADNWICTKVYDVSDLVVCRGEHDELWDDYDTLTGIIESTIRPTSWDDVGGAGAINGATLGKAKVLVVDQTDDVHTRIADLLAQIRAVAKKNPDGQLPRRNKPAGPSEKKPSVGLSPKPQGFGMPTPPSASPESKPGAVTPPTTGRPSNPGVPPGGMGPVPGGLTPPGMMPPGMAPPGGMWPPGAIPRRPKATPPDEERNPFVPEK